jgi:hypothetical protein
MHEEAGASACPPLLAERGISEPTEEEYAEALAAVAR